MKDSPAAWRRLSLVAWVASVVLILLAAVLLVGFGGESIDTTRIDLENQRDLRNREVPLGTVALVAVAGAAAFGFGGWSRMKAEQVERSQSASSFGVRPTRPASPRTDPPARAIHDDTLPPRETRGDDADPDSDAHREQP